MKNAIILHGLPDKEEYYDPTQPSSSNNHWKPWLQKQLIVHDIKADTPEVFQAYAPKWDVWVKEVERFDIGIETLAVGHSMGGGFWIRYLTEHPEIKIDKLVLVAPWMNPDREEDFDFFDFKISTVLEGQVNQFTIFASDNDAKSVKTTVALLREAFPSIYYKEFHNYGHFCIEDMHTVEFPELLEVLI